MNEALAIAMITALVAAALDDPPPIRVEEE
jgi:hypothetical protein